MDVTETDRLHFYYASLAKQNASLGEPPGNVFLTLDILANNFLPYSFYESSISGDLSPVTIKSGIKLQAKIAGRESDTRMRLLI